MAGCGVERVGEARMEDHWEADHKDRLVEEWIYQVSCWGPVARILLRWGGGGGTFSVAGGQCFGSGFKSLLDPDSGA